ECFSNDTDMKSIWLLALPLLALAAAVSNAQTTQPSTQPSTTKPTTLPTPTADYEVRDWAVFVVEPTAPRANAVASIKSTFPLAVVTRRTEAEASDRQDPMPIGVLRVIGGA